MPSTPELIELRPDQAREYNAFLLRAVREHPDTLRMSERDIVASPFTVPDPADGAILVALAEDGRWAGTAAVERERGREKRAHIAWLVRMYVVSELAGTGIGGALLVRAIERARRLPGVGKLNLTVAAHNNRAVRLYERHGFREFSREEDAFRDPVARTELTLALGLSRNDP